MGHRRPVHLIALLALALLGATPGAPVYTYTGSDPAGACVGQRVWINTTTGAPFCCAGSAWAACGFRIDLYTTATRPTCDASWAGKLIRLRDPGTAEQLQECGFQASGTYAWASATIAPDQTVAGTMAWGADFVTVGGTFTSAPSGSACVFTHASNAIGGATSASCKQTSTSSCALGTQHYLRSAIAVAVGAKQKFRSIDLQVDGGWPCTPWTSTANTVITIQGCRLTAENAPATWSAGPNIPSTSTTSLGASKSGTIGTMSIDGIALDPEKEFGSNYFMNSGRITLNMDTTTYTNWSKGWNASVGGPDPGGSSADYYWIYLTNDSGWGATYTMPIAYTCCDNAGDGCNSSATAGSFPALSVQATGVWP